MSRALFLLAPLTAIAASLASCTTGPLTSISSPHPGFDPDRHLFEWHDDGGPGEVAVKINLNTQRATYTRGGRPIGWSFVATGKEGHGTPAGRYSITEKLEEKYSGSYGWIEDEFGNTVNGDATPGTRVPKNCHYMPAPMPYWMRITGYGIGMHAGIIPNPGEPASHGCIRLPKPFAPILFDNVRVGTPVTITYGG